MEQSNSLSRHERNSKERDRRLHMKDLLERLASLVYPQPPKLSAPELVNQTTIYVKNLRGRIEKLKRQKALYETSTEDDEGTSKETVLDLKMCNSVLVGTVICGLNKKLMSHEIIRVLQDEGAEVISFTFQRLSNSMIYTFKSQAISPRIGIETSRVNERLKQLIR